MELLVYILILSGICLQSTVDSQRTIRYYSRAASEWRTMNVPAVESGQGGLGAGGNQSAPLGTVSSVEEPRGRYVPLQYGVNYRGIGRLSTPTECARSCQLGAAPRNCYYRFTVELYRTLGGACRLCQPKTNTSLTSDCQCIQADGVDQSGLMTVNRMLPGPSIQMCLGDLAIIDVHNQAIGTGITIHWHGLYQNGYQYYDGVPFVTQCPISHGSTFRYKWRAHNSGTHFYHAHTGLHKPDGLEGAIVIRAPELLDLNKHLYDDDNFDNIIFINDLFHDASVSHWPGTSTRNIGQLPQNLLINGKGQYFDPVKRKYTDVPLATFNVKPNRRIRFRMINSLSWTCPVQLSIEEHTLTIISTDGEDVRPHVVTTITAFSAERYDFVITTNRRPRTYWIHARLTGGCTSSNISQVAMLRYDGAPLTQPPSTRPVGQSGFPLGTVFNDINQVCGQNSAGRACVHQLQSVEQPNSRIQSLEPDMSIFLPFQFYAFRDAELFRPNQYQHFQVPTGSLGSVALLSNISNIFMGSPLLTQTADIPPAFLCNGEAKPRTCAPGKPCFCSHVVDIPLGSVVDIIMADVGPNGLSHPFHIHGYGCHVMAQGLLKDVRITEANKLEALALHRRFYGNGHQRPVTKDTLATPSGGYTICRFIADNPGYWLYHCHFMSHLLVGMELTLHVGMTTDLPPIPNGFPKCGDFAASIRDP